MSLLDYLIQFVQEVWNIYHGKNGYMSRQAVISVKYQYNYLECLLILLYNLMIDFKSYICVVK